MFSYLQKLMHGPELPRIYTLFGDPVVGNPTQYMMERAFTDKGIDSRYITCKVAAAGLKEAISGMRVLGFSGANITVPHKVSVIKYLDLLTESAQLIGAVNCIFKSGDDLVGDNTDGKGFIEALAPVIEPVGKNVVLLGAGGAARAVAVELGLSKIGHLTVVNRTAKRGNDLVKDIIEKIGVDTEFIQWDGEYIVPKSADILINATSIGLNAPNERVPVDFSQISKECIVADLVFNPVETCFLKEAAECGCKTLDGLGMLVNQGAIAFKIWTGIEPDTEVMRMAIQHSFAEMVD